MHGESGLRDVTAGCGESGLGGCQNRATLAHGLLMWNAKHACLRNCDMFMEFGNAESVEMRMPPMQLHLADRQETSDMQLMRDGGGQGGLEAGRVWNW